MTNPTRAIRGAFAVTALALVGSCASSTARRFETGLAQVMVSPEQENQIGLKLKEDLDTKQGIVYMTDPEVVEYVRGVANNVIQFGKKDRPDVTWQVFIIDESKTVNAFATPGGYLYVYRGLLEAAANEAELAAVMAHETGHVVARHSARSMVAAYGVEQIAALAAGKNPGLLTKVTTTIAGRGLLLSHTRSEETEADEYGARYSSAAGYDPRGFVTFFEKLKKSEGSTPGILTYLSDHPATEDRIAHINAYVVSQKLGGTNLGTEAYAKLRKRLAALPASPAKAAPGGAPPAPPAGAPPAPPAGAPPPA